MDDWAKHTDHFNCNRYKGDDNEEIEETDIAQPSNSQNPLRANAQIQNSGRESNALNPSHRQSDIKQELNKGTSQKASNKSNQFRIKNSSDARKALERYMHYYTRFSVHHQSLKLESSLLAKTEWNMETLQAKTELTWIDLDFYRNAIKTLLICRSTLKYSYAFAYYLKRSNYTEIFEDNQRDLELAVENLSTLVENPILASSPALFTWKQSLLDKSNYVSSRRENVITDVQTGLLEDRWNFHTIQSSF